MKIHPLLKNFLIKLKSLVSKLLNPINVKLSQQPYWHIDGLSNKFEIVNVDKLK